MFFKREFKELSDMSGAFDANKLQQHAAEPELEGEYEEEQSVPLPAHNSTSEEPFSVADRRIGSFDAALNTNNRACKIPSCPFGIEDLKLLLSRPELSAHGFDLNYQPASYFCLWGQIRKRALDTPKQQHFEGKLYRKALLSDTSE